ncbi:MAG: SpoIID/LytB domain-containing protein [Oscillatoria sp. PMC 1051.18]|nr:SpoIID/LytB domain-containing protein [Oscillatoria sp. PMC 1050.18]MEC5032050.1 SpoIID/LytB domain-containing protein [Oscillatoria sp. PMC 1051.18]
MIFQLRASNLFSALSCILFLGFSSANLALPKAIAQTGGNEDIELEVGVVQRFGDEVTDKLRISSTSGNVLTLSFLGGDMQPRTLETDSITLEINPYPLEEPVIFERVVLSDRATFETAEDSANNWQKLGIEVEITQPGRWQVWADPDVYKTPLLRRLLLESLREKGYTNPYLETEVVEALPRISFIVGGYRYSRLDLEISASNNLIQVAEGEEGENPILYAGTMKVQRNSYWDFTLVNQVPLETYLRGVVPHEIGAGAPYNAIEAQTILARTYALRNLRRFAADDYQLCATVHCQVYRGLTGTAASADKAIAATTGQVLTYNNELVDALYSSTAGGVTSFFNDIWDGENRPYLRSIIDSPLPVWDLSQQSLADEATFRRFINLKEGFNETGVSLFRWNKQSSIEQLNEDFRKYLERIKHPLADFTTIQNMAVTERSPSGRILTLTVQTDKGIVELEKTEARSAFGPPRSTLFYLEPIYDANQVLKGYAFVGGGFGHGVGMSQYGSYNLAKLGWTAEKILAFYYPGTEIEKLDRSIVFWRETNEE